MIKFENHWSTGKQDATNLGSKDSAALGLNKTECQDIARNPSMKDVSVKLLRVISSLAKSVPRENKNFSMS